MTRLTPETREQVYLRAEGICECGCGQPAEQFHHALYTRTHPELINEPDNIVAVAWICHASHHNASKRFPRSICHRAERFANTPKIRAELERLYGPEHG